MSIVSKLKDALSFAPSHEEGVVLFDNHEHKQIGGSFHEIRVGVPDHDVYARPQALSGRFGEKDYDSPNVDEQRTGYIGLIGRLVSMRAHEFAQGMCRAMAKREVERKKYKDIEGVNPWGDLLSDPSPNASAYDFWYDVSQMRDLGRGAFAAVGRNERKIADALYLIYPEFGTVECQPNNLGGIEGYVYSNNGGVNSEFPAADMLWIRHRSPASPYMAASLLQLAAFQSDVALAQAIYARDMTSQGTAPAVYASVKGDLGKKQQQEYGEALKEYMGNPSRANKKKVLVMGGDGKLEKLGINPNDLQYIEAAQLTDHQIMRIFGFPPAMFEASGVVANSDVVYKQWMRGLEKEIIQTCSSLTKQFKRTFDAADSNLVIVPPSIVPVDPLDTQRVREIQVRTGQRSINELREEDMLEGITAGDTYYMSAGLQPVEQTESTEEDAATD